MPVLLVLRMAFDEFIDRHLFKIFGAATNGMNFLRHIRVKGTTYCFHQRFVMTNGSSFRVQYRNEL